ncbi:hypothetical protein GGR57DRAFT_159028 [Xylariaceae sp. FL1272]|nr:hypothetical protein GGR57DRAFT_159028 [Xylariaceae sp. FL1272]
MTLWLFCFAIDMVRSLDSCPCCASAMSSSSHYLYALLRTKMSVVNTNEFVFFGALSYSCFICEQLIGVGDGLYVVLYLSSRSSFHELCGVPFGAKCLNLK